MMINKKPLKNFADSVLRGIGQVFLQNNTYTGLLFLIGVFCNSILFGSAVLVGTIVSTMTAIMFGANKDQIKDGLFGFNGALVGVALINFLQPDAYIWGYVVFASACSSIVMALTLRLLNTWKMPTLTFPFVFTTLAFLLMSAHFGKFQLTHTPDAVTIEGIVTTSTIVEGFFKGVAQVFFQDNVITGIFFMIGLFVSSKRAGMMAILGSFIGLLIAWALGAEESAIGSGIFGFNPVLTAIAMGSFITILNAATMTYILVAIIATFFAAASVTTALSSVGMPALTLPFVLVAWVFIGASRLVVATLLDHKSAGT